MSKGLVYKNIFSYRTIMWLLYGGKYKARFDDIIGLLNEDVRSIVDLCFGDVYIAGYCKSKNISWTGFDTNESFVRYARKKGFNASNADVLTLDHLPPCDVCIISGSLYHFHQVLYEVLNKMLESAKVIIISEPIINLSSRKGLIGKIAAASSNAGSGAERFRFSEGTFIKAIDDLSATLNYTYSIISINRDILVTITHD
jgi:hypothetical protein